MQHDEQSIAGDWGALLATEQDRLERMIRVRMDPRLRNRLDAADIVQECFLEATRRRQEFLEQSAMPRVVWLRLLALQKLAEMHRRHLYTRARSVYQEHRSPTTTSAVLAANLLGELTSPSRAAVRHELEQRLVEAIETLDPVDRECIILRNFERLTNEEAAKVLGLNPSTTSSRYVRALVKLRRQLELLDGFSNSNSLFGP